MDCLCLMWDAPERGKLTGAVPRLARSLGLTVDEFRAFLNEADETGLADVTPCHADVTTQHNEVVLVNRRMLREHNTKYNAALRKKRQREREKASMALSSSHVKITPSSSSSSSSPQQERERERSGSPMHGSTVLPDSSAQDEPVISSRSHESNVQKAAFLAFWKVYPNKANQDDAWYVWQELGRSGQLPAQNELHQSIMVQAASSRWQQQGGRFIPDPANWLRKRRWRDALPPATTTKSGAVSSEQRGQAPRPKSYAQCQDAERQSQAVFALQYMREQQPFDAYGSPDGAITPHVHVLPA